MHRTGTLILCAIALAGCPSKHVYADGRGIEGQLEREIIALTEEKKLYQAQAEACQQGGGTNDLYPELKQIIVSPDVAVASKGPVTLVTMPDTHLFGADDVSIREEARVTLDLLAEALQAHKDYTVVIEGHTADLIPPAQARLYTSLRDLSYAHAQAVHDALVDDFHVPDEQLTLASRGPYAPIASNDTAAGQARNRRVVVVIYPPGMR